MLLYRNTLEKEVKKSDTLSKQQQPYEIQGSKSTVAEDSGLLGYTTDK